jgi:hypothetical protein
LVVTATTPFAASGAVELSRPMVPTILDVLDVLGLMSPSRLKSSLPLPKVVELCCCSS